MIFKRPSDMVFDSHHSWSPQFAFSLNFNLLRQSNYLQLSQVPDPAVTSIVEHFPALRSAESARTVDSKPIPTAIKTHRELRDIFNTTEKNLRVFFDRKVASETIYAMPRAVNLEALLSAEPGWFAPPASDHAHRQVEKGRLQNETPRPALQSYVDQIRAAKAFKTDVETLGIGLGSQFNAFVMAVSSTSRLPANDRQHVEISRDEDDLTAPALNRKWVEIARQETKTVGESMAQPYPGGDALVATDYVFAKTFRPSATEEQVITQVEEREIVEIVRKEVRTMMSSSALMQNLSRADYTRIADHVYSDLARRLIAERERVGLR